MLFSKEFEKTVDPSITQKSIGDLLSEEETTSSLIISNASPKDTKKYHPLFQLAGGKTSQVFLALEQQGYPFSRLVVIKKISKAHWDGDNKKANGEFLYRSRIMKSLNHPLIPKIYNIRENDKELIFIMEYVDGETLYFLSSELRKKDEFLPIHIACGIVSQACVATHNAHKATTIDGDHIGLTHRDINPHNIMVDSNGYVKMLNWGFGHLFKESDGAPLLNSADTAAWIAPEIIQGHRPDYRSDIYSLGLLLYNLLSGRRPFELQHKTASMADTVDSVLFDALPDVSIFNRGIPNAFDKIIARATHRDRYKRYQNAEQLGEAIASAAGKHDKLARENDIKLYFRRRFHEHLMTRRTKEISAVMTQQDLREKRQDDMLRLSRKRMGQVNAKFVAITGRPPASSITAPTPQSPPNAP